MNRSANYSPSVDLEIESSILRGLVPSAVPADVAAIEAETARLAVPEKTELTAASPSAERPAETA